MSVDTSNATAAAGVDSLRARIAGAIKQAATTTGASFEYMLATAKMESDFNPTAGASTSSARGLYQFIEQTWLATVKEAGGQLGYGQYADAIGKTTSGDYVVVDPTMRRAIMKLRDDPAASSAMAAVLTQSNSFQLTGKIGRRPSDAELYMAHFLGIGGAAKLITNAEEAPDASAVRMFPSAAAANRSIFYDRGGQPRSVSEVYNVLETRYASAANSPATKTALALYGDVPAVVAAATAAGATTVAPVVDSATYLSTFPDVRNAAPAPAVASADAPSAKSAPVDPIFRSLFQVDNRTPPISTTVRELWGNSASLTSGTSSTPSAPRPLDLFSDRDGTFSS
jgi:Transglycosylase SLT domain